MQKSKVTVAGHYKFDVETLKWSFVSKLLLRNSEK